MEKLLCICDYYNADDSKDWFVFIGTPTNANAKKCFKAFWDTTLKDKDINGVWSITKEQDTNGKDYSIIIK